MRVFFRPELARFRRREVGGAHLSLDLPVFRQEESPEDVLFLAAEPVPERNQIRDGRGEPADGMGGLSRIIVLCAMRNEIAGSRVAKLESPTR